MGALRRSRPNFVKEVIIVPEKGSAFSSLVGSWLEATRGKHIPLGLEAEEAVARASQLRESLRNGEPLTERPIDFGLLESLHALSGLLARFSEREAMQALEEASGTFEIVSKLDWPEQQIVGQAELLTDLAFTCWRAARLSGEPAREAFWRVRFRERLDASSPLRLLAEEALDRIDLGSSSDPTTSIEDPEMLLAVCEILALRIDAAPAEVFARSAFYYRLLEESLRDVDGPAEVRQFLGEFALLAGGANRILFHRQEARGWFERAESNFMRVASANVHLARLGYQRLALALEERRLEEVLQLTPSRAEEFRRFGLFEEALKCQFLEGLAHWETGNSGRAISIYREIYSESERLGLERLAAQAANNLAHYYSLTGESENAIAFSRKALPLLQKTGHRVALAKLQWTVGDLLRGQGKLPEAVDAYRTALRESEDIGLRSETAAIRLVLAELLLDVGQEAQAEREIRAALPIIDEERMVPEAVAALTLLRESVRRRRIDRQALSNLRGYFRR